MAIWAELTLRRYKIMRLREYCHFNIALFLRLLAVTLSYFLGNNYTSAVMYDRYRESNVENIFQDGIVRVYWIEVLNCSTIALVS